MVTHTEMRVLGSDGVGAITLHPSLPAKVDGWLWVDVLLGQEDGGAFLEIAESLGLDALAVRDAIEEHDLPKVDDFGDHWLVVLHGFADDTVATYELDCFVTSTHLITVRRSFSPSAEALWQQIQKSPQLAKGGTDELTARLADVLTRRLASVLDVFDDRIDELTTMALEADDDFLQELTDMRMDLATARRVAQPQREALDFLRRSSSNVISDAGRRRFSDVFDVASRTSTGLDAARSALAETLDAYRGAEAGKATDVMRVLTIYTAVMLPLTLIVGFFGMNFVNLPGFDSEIGWWITGVAMSIVAVVSVSVFAAMGWIKMPGSAGRRRSLGRGLAAAVRKPIKIVGAVFEIALPPPRPGDRNGRTRRE